MAHLGGVVQGMARIAFVTGGASGIGLAIAQRLSVDGLRVAIVDRDPEMGAKSLASLSGPAGIFVTADVTDRQSLAEAVTRTTTELGAVDILVNVAGGDVVTPFVDTDEDLWYRLLELNLLGVMRTVHLILPSMIERGSGRVINISSEAGRVGSSGQAVYSAAKGGVIAFGRTIAREVARTGVTVNTVCPGPTLTPQMQRTLDSGSEKYVAALTRAIPAGRLGDPEDVAQAVALFASEGSGFITGQTLSVSGGMTMI